MILRVARHTQQLSQLVDFYVQVMGLDVIDEFKDHDGYNGVMLGKQHQNWHLEFTQTSQAPHHTFDADDLLVFYPETQAEYETFVHNINRHNIQVVPAKNPYWQTNGIVIKDPDGYGIVISPIRLN